MYRDALPPGQLVQFPLMAIDRLGVPFWMLTFYPEHGPTNAGSGYGTTDEEALTGAFGELTEVVSANRAVGQMERIHGSYRDIVREYGENTVVDPLTLCLEAGSSYTLDQQLQWVRVHRYPSGEPVLAPLEFVACQNSDVGAGNWLITLITNGLGAGKSYEQAVSHGLLELLQRDGNSVTFRALGTGVVVELDDVRDPQTRTMLNQLDNQGVEVSVKLASTDFGMTNLYVVGYDREHVSPASPIMTLACGEAAHPDREIALRKALLEFAAARSRVAFSHGPLQIVEQVTPPEYLPNYIAHYNPQGEEARALHTMLNLYPRTLTEMRELLANTVFATRTTVPFSSLPTVSDPIALADRSTLLNVVAQRLIDAGFDILVADYSAPGSDVFAVKVIVPGLEVETMSYHRIGERNVRRLLEQGSQLVGVGSPPPGALSVPLTEAAQQRLGGPVWFDVTTAEQLVGDQYALYREPGRHAAALISTGRIEAMERGA
jgi:ribosomal protein S12 methylthiotransferase accessory factor